MNHNHLFVPWGVVGNCVSESNRWLDALGIYHVVNGCYLSRWLHQRVLSTKMTSSTRGIFQDYFVKRVLSTKMTSSTGAIYQDDFANGCYLPRKLRQRVFSTLADFVNGHYLRRWLRQRVVSFKITSSTGAIFQDDFTNGCYPPRWLL